MLPREERLHQLNIDIIRYEQVSLDSTWKCDNARNYFTRLYLIQSGSGELYCGDETVKLQAGSIYLVPSEYDFGFGCQQQMDKIFFHVLLPSGEKTDLLSEAGKVLALPGCQDMIDRMTALFDATETASFLEVKALVYSILVKMIAYHKLQFSENREFSGLVQNTLDYIWKNVSVKLSVRDIAANLFVSESKLRNSFRKEIHMPIGKYIDNAVFFTVREMLTAGESIEHIANTLEFCDRNFLSRRFKEKFGKTISQYRQDLFV